VSHWIDGGWILEPQPDEWWVFCKLRRNNQRKSLWVPEALAVLGKIIKFKEGPDWSDGWDIVHLGARRNRPPSPRESILHFRDRVTKI